MFVVSCDGVLIVRISAGCVAGNIRDVFGRANFEFTVFGEMLSERMYGVDWISAIQGGGFELNELRRRRYSGTFPFPFGMAAIDMV